MTRLSVFILVFCALASGQTEIINTVAGGGSSGPGDGGPATSATLNQPGGVFVDASGNLFIVDTNNGRIREVPAGSNIITTVAGNGCCGFGGDGGPATSALFYQPLSVAVDSSGNLYIADTGNDLIRKVSASSGIITTIAGRYGLEGYAGDGGPAMRREISSSRTP
jgi:hypothetical protein